MSIKRPAEIKADPVISTFKTLWNNLFSSSVHLDSALSKLTPAGKTAMASFVPLLLRAPASLAQGLGIGVPSGEPWNLRAAELSSWKPGLLAAERYSELRAVGAPFPGFALESGAADFPEWMLEEWRREWGDQTTETLAKVLGSEAPLSLRARRTLGAEGLLKLLKKMDLPVRITPSAISPVGAVLSGYAQVLNTEDYQKGSYEIQDEGSQFMALFALWPELLGPRLQEAPGPSSKEFLLPQLPTEVPSWVVVDACAGAGGKTLALADALRGRGRVFSYDTAAPKLTALRRRVSRGEFTNIQTVPLQEGREDEVIGKFRKRANIVLVDAPCTGWGVLRRNPDIKWRQTVEVRDRMPQIQKRLLTVYSSLVAPGGRLVYGVCTFRKAETIEVVEAFLAAQPEFEKAQGGYLGPQSSDGFFMQAFVRKGAAK